MGQRVVSNQPLPSRRPQVIPLDDPGPIKLGPHRRKPPPFQPDPLLIGYLDGDIEKRLNSRWWRWRFRNKPDHFKIARMEARLGLPQTTDPADWVL